MRGIPGSGKSTRAWELETTGESICSTDDYFMVNGVYKFDSTKIQFYHNLNFQKFLVMLAEKRPVVVVDNTNTQAWEYKEYVLAARRFKYDVEFVTFAPHRLASGQPDPWYVAGCAQKNSHGVPLEAVTKMAERFEDADNYFRDVEI